MPARLDVTPIFGEILHTFDEDSGLIIPMIWDGKLWQNMFSDIAIEIMKKLAGDNPPPGWKPFAPEKAD